MRDVLFLIIRRGVWFNVYQKAKEQTIILHRGGLIICSYFVSPEMITWRKGREGFWPR